MTFKEFQKTREFRNDLLSYDDEIVEGYIYGDFIANKYIEENLHIYRIPLNKLKPETIKTYKLEGLHAYELTIERSDYLTNNLKALEKILYKWAKNEGYFKFMDKGKKGD